MQPRPNLAGEPQAASLAPDGERACGSISERKRTLPQLWRLQHASERVPLVK
jgi:hypothetical protein